MIRIKSAPKPPDSLTREKIKRAVRSVNMIETKDLVEFIRNEVFPVHCQTDKHEYMAEIVARLRAYDKLKESIENLIARMSSGVDKEE